MIKQISSHNEIESGDFLLVHSEANTEMFFVIPRAEGLEGAKKFFEDSITAIIKDYKSSVYLRLSEYESPLRQKFIAEASLKYMLDN